MEQDEVHVAWQPLQDFTKEVFVRAGVPPKDAEIEAEVLVWANLRGIDSHGVQRIPGYVERLDTGQMNPRPNIRVVQETPATVFIEADHALGPVVTTFAMDQVIAKAQEVGIGWGFIRNTTHQGAMGYYALMAAKRDLAGIALVCSPPNMAPFGARAPGVHNSPIAIAVPGNRRRPLILDMATSVAAGGKLDVARDKGVPIPDNWAMDRDGKPTTDPHQAAALLPAAGHKGYGLALMFECLSSLMVGNPLLVPTLLGRDSAPVPGTQNSVVAAIDIGSFTDAARYREDVDELVGALKALPKAAGFDEIFVPGEPEDRVYDNRVQHGIPMPPGTLRRLHDVAQRFEIALPPGL